MAQQQINTGNSANDGTGDNLRAASQKSNMNFSELYALTNSIQTIANAAISAATSAQTDADQALTDAAAANSTAIAAQSTANTAQDGVDALEAQQDLITVPYAATVDLDFDVPGYRTITVIGDLTFTFSNLVPSDRVLLMTVHLFSDGSPHNLTFPDGVIFYNAIPASITAFKNALLVFTSLGGIVHATYKEHVDITGGN